MFEGERASPRSGQGLPKSGLALLICLALAGCSSPGTAPSATRERGFDPRQLIKTDLNRVAEAHQHHIFASLRRLAGKLYKRNPREWRKSDAPSAEAAISRIFDEQHRWRFESLGNRRDLDALHVALHPDYRGDRVQALIVGLASMVQSAFGDREVFYLLDDLEPQQQIALRQRTTIHRPYGDRLHGLVQYRRLSFVGTLLNW